MYKDNRGITVLCIQSSLLTIRSMTALECACITECCIKAETVVVNGSSVLFILSIWLVVLAMQVTDPWCMFNTLHVMTCTTGVSFI